MAALRRRPSWYLILCVLAVGVGLAAFGTSCSAADPSGMAEVHHGIVASSVRACWQQALALAQEWRPDARIVEIRTTAKVPAIYRPTYAVKYQMQSPSEEYTKFLASCTPEGIRTVTVDEKPGRPIALLPAISLQDFTIDSQQALDIAIQNGDSRLALSPDSWVVLFLTRTFPWFRQRLVWVVLFSLPSTGSTFICIDANTGEVLKII
jgi:hypothetical protein